MMALPKGWPLSLRGCVMTKVQLSRKSELKLPDSLNLERRCAQMASLTVLLYGNGREAFNELFEHDRDNILWLVSDLTWLPKSATW